MKDFKVSGETFRSKEKTTKEKQLALQNRKFLNWNPDLNPKR